MAVCEKNVEKLEMYKNLILSLYDRQSETVKGLASFNRIIDALKIPVFTAEVNIRVYITN